VDREYWDREELYELVWSKPFTELAKEYDISDVGLRKTCVRLNIPVPRAGYWAKVRSGKKVVKPPLPEYAKNLTALKPLKRTIVPTGKAGDRDAEPTILDEEKREAYREALAFEGDPAHSIIVRSGGPMTEIGLNTSKALQKLTKTGTPISLLPAGMLDIRVSSVSAERAISICEALIAAFELRGWKFSLGTEAAPRSMHVEVFGYSIPFWIEEKFKRQEHILTAVEEKEKAKDPWKYSYKIYDHVPTGLLILRAGEKHTYGNPGYRVRWADGKRMKIESEIGDFCKALIHAAIKKRNYDIESEIRKRQWEQEEKRRQEMAYLQSLEDRRVKNLQSTIGLYDMMMKTRALISYVRERANSTGTPIEGDLAAWCQSFRSAPKRLPKV